MASNLSAHEIQKGMRLSIIDGLLGQPFYGLTWPTGAFLIGFALLLGANNFEIGLIAAMGPLVSGANLLAAVWIERAGQRRPFFLRTIGIHRAVIFAFLLLPLLSSFLSARERVGVFLGVILLSLFFGALGGTAWVSWMSDLIPEDRRGTFFSKRNMLAGGLWMILSYGFGKLIDSHNHLWTYAVIFSGATVLSLIALGVTARQPEPPLAVSEKRPPWLSLWKTAYASPGFRNLLLFQILWGFAVGLAGPFYNVYMLKTLQMGMSTIAALGIVAGVVGTLTLFYWGILGDRAGNRVTLLFCLIGSCASAFGWLFVTGDNAFWLMPAIFALSGFFDTGAGLISFTALLGVLPKKDNTRYVAIYQTVVGTFLGIAPIVGGYLATILPGIELSFISMNPVLTLIAISTIIRIFPLAFVMSMPTQQGRGMGFMLQEFVLANPFKLFPSLSFSRKSADEKLEAIGNLSHMRSRAATPELVLSMRDINPRVRLRAVRALGEIGDRQALPELLKALDDPLEDMQAEAILAIGKLGEPRAVPVLLEKLESLDQHLQRSAALALGDLRATDAVDPLIRLMKQTDRSMVRVACADALGRIQSYRAIEPLIELTRAVPNRSLKPTLVASAGLLIDTQGELYKMLSQPELYLEQAAERILNPRTVKLARKAQSPLRKNLTSALAAFYRKNYNEAILEMKIANQLAVWDLLAEKSLKDVLGFEPWVRLLDSHYSIQLQSFEVADSHAGNALAIVDYYARHCPSPSEPDMDSQEFLLALYAFKQGQERLYDLMDDKDLLCETFGQKRGEIIGLVPDPLQAGGRLTREST